MTHLYIFPKFIYGTKIFVYTYFGMECYSIVIHYESQIITRSEKSLILLLSICFVL